jgi:hypothetical protein
MAQAFDENVRCSLIPLATGKVEYPLAAVLDVDGAVLIAQVRVVAILQAFCFCRLRTRSHRTGHPSLVR